MVKIVTVTWQQMFVNSMLLNPTSAPARGCQKDKISQVSSCSPHCPGDPLMGDLFKSLEPMSVASFLRAHNGPCVIDGNGRRLLITIKQILDNFAGSEELS